MILYIIRGLQGAGKTTKALSLNPAVHAEADQFFTTNGVYRWKAPLIGEAHNWCQAKIKQAMIVQRTPIVVSNTFVKKSLMASYFEMATAHGYDVEVIDLFDGGCSDEELFKRCVHAVPLETIQRNRLRYER